MKVGIFNRRPKEPSYAQHIGLAEISRPTPEGYELTESLAHLFSVDETVIQSLKENPDLAPAAIAFGATSDTNYLDPKGVKLTEIRIRKAFLYLQNNMTKNRRRELLSTIEFLQLNALTRAANNRKGKKLELLTTLQKRILVAEGKKEESGF